MIEPENPVVASGTTHPSEEPASRQDLREELHRLRSLFNTALLAMLLLSVAVNAFLLYQYRMVRAELDGARKLTEEFQTVKWPLVNKLVAGLQSFAQAHPDFTPILEKYGLKSSPTAQSSQPGPLPASGKPGK
jgi:hypothetical protein